MNEVFRGASTHTLDDKARLIVPKRFLDRLPKVDTEFVLTASQDRCLLLLSRSSFDDRAKASVTTIDPLGEDASQRAKLRRFLGHAEEVKPDRAGRITISEFLRQYMGLDKEAKQVVVVGMGEMIELWSVAGWHGSMQHDDSGPSSLPSESVGSKQAADEQS